MDVLMRSGEAGVRQELTLFRPRYSQAGCQGWAWCARLRRYPPFNHS